MRPSRVATPREPHGYLRHTGTSDKHILFTLGIGEGEESCQANTRFSRRDQESNVKANLFACLAGGNKLTNPAVLVNSVQMLLFAIARCFNSSRCG